MIRACELRLGAPAHPGDTVPFTGASSRSRATRRREHAPRGRARWSRPAHVTARVTVVLATVAVVSGRRPAAGAARDRRHRRDRVLQGLRALGAAALGRGHAGRSRGRRAGARGRRRPGHLHDGQQQRDRAGPRAGDGRAAVLQPHQLRRRRRLRDRAAGRDGGRDRGGRRRRLLPRLQRALGAALRPGAELGRRPGEHQRPRQRLLLPARAEHAGRDGGDAGPPLHARVRRHQRGLRSASRSPTGGTRR